MVRTAALAARGLRAGATMTGGDHPGGGPLQRGHTARSRAKGSEEHELPEAEGAGTGEPDGEWPEDWHEGATRRTISFYHAEGVPYLDDEGEIHDRPPAEELEELGKAGATAATGAESDDDGGGSTPDHDPAGDRDGPASSPRRRRRQPSPPDREPPGADVPAEAADHRPSARVREPMDLSVLEHVAYLLVRRVFRHGIRFPVRKEGVADLDVTIKDKDVVIDAHRLMFEVPRLSVWRITFAYRGEPLVVFGRGVKGDLKVHPVRFARFLFRTWLEKKRRERSARKRSASGHR